MRWIEHQTTEGMLSSAPEMNVRLPNTRSQDDATVGYFFQRPQTDQDFQNYSKQTRWAVGDDSVLEVRHSNDTEYDSELQALGREVNHQGLEDPSSFGRFGVRNGSLSLANDGYQRSQQEALPQLAPSTKKLWSDDSKGGIFLDDQWRGWGASEHAVSQPMLVQRRGPGGDIGTVLSPRSSDTGGLGVKMVEYVLASSPTGGGLESRMARLAMDDKTKLDIKKEQDPLPQQNGVVQNGLDDDKGFNRQPSPSHNDLVNNHADMNKLTKEEMVNAHHMMAMNQAHMGFESQMDPLGFEYNSQLMTSVDSPSVMDYNGQMFPRQQQQQQQQMMMAQQQFAMAQQQQQQMGMAPGGFPSNPYVLNPQDPCAQVGPMMTAGPMMPPYYGMPPWGMYPQAGNMIQQQQQLMRENIGRPNTPQQQNIDPLGSVQQANGNQYSMMTPQFYDQNNPMLLGNNRGMATPMRLMPSGPMMMNGGNQGTMNSNPLRLLGSQSSLYSNPGPSTPQSSLFNSSQSSSGLGFNPTGLSGSTTNGFGLQNGYGSSSLGTLGSSTFGAMGLAASTQRRGSLERRDVTGLTSNLELSRQIKTPYYGALGSIGSGQGSLGSLIPGQGGLEVLSSPGQSLTPPPSSSLSLGGLMSGSRVISAAPGAETKFRNGSAANGIFGNSSLLSRQSTGLDKPSNRSRLLEDFRNNRYPNLQLRDLSNHIVEFSQDQHGSRFIQQKLERATLPEKQLVFNEILTAAYSLMMDVFGNYVIQKFFEFGTPEQKQMLAQRVRGHVLPLALQMYGCRVIQKALDSIPMDQQKDLVKELDGHVLKCVKDQNGNHVVQKCIETVDPSALQFIINSFQGQVFTLSTHPYGCRVIQRILEHCTAEQTASILEELHQNVEQLVQDQYGNYVIQHVLERGRPEDKSRIVAMISGKVLPLAQHKFASNVVEKCVTHATRSERAVLIEEVCTVMDGPNSALYLMMKDQFANYVIQKMLDMAEPAQRKILMHKIKPHVATLKKFTYGKHILAKLEKFFMKVDINGGM